MGKNDTQVYGLAVGLKEADAQSILAHIPGAGSAESKLSSIATGLLRDLARGGQMIDPQWATRVETALGTTDPQAIVDAVEKSVKRCGDAARVEWIPDPTQINFYRMLADNVAPNGISLEHQLKSILDHAFEQGWLGSAAPDVYKLLLSAQQWRYLQQTFEKDIPTGQDVMEKLRHTFGSPAVVSEDDAVVSEDDAVLDSLVG